MKTRTKARIKAFETIFEASQRHINALDLYDQRLQQWGKNDAPPNPYIREIIEGVVKNQHVLDEHLASFSHGWTLSRMSAVDLAILRIGAWEILLNPEVTDSIILSEAVALAQKFSSDKAPKFINGVLGRVEKMKDTL